MFNFFTSTIFTINFKIFVDWTGILRKQCDSTYQRKRRTDMDCPIGQDNLAVLKGVGIPHILYRNCGFDTKKKCSLPTVIRYVLASKPTPLSTPCGVAKY